MVFVSAGRVSLLLYAFQSGTKEGSQRVTDYAPGYNVPYFVMDRPGPLSLLYDRPKPTQICKRTLILTSC